MNVELIRTANPVPDILSRYGVEIKGDRCRGFCHNGRDMNMWVSDEVCYCYVCSRAFDVFDVVMFFDNCGFPDAVRTLGGEGMTYAEQRRLETRRVKRQREIKAEINKKDQYLSWREEWLECDLVEPPDDMADDFEPYAQAQQRKAILEFLMDSHPGW